MSDNYPQIGKAYVWQFKMVDDTDGKTPETGLTPVVTISKGGAAFATATGAPSVSEIASGWYEIVIPAADMVSRIILLAVDGTSRDTVQQMSPAGDWIARLVGKHNHNRSTQVTSIKQPDGTTEQFAMTYANVDDNNFTWTPS